MASGGDPHVSGVDILTTDYNWSWFHSNVITGTDRVQALNEIRLVMAHVYDHTRHFPFLAILTPIVIGPTNLNPYIFFFLLRPNIRDDCTFE